MRFEDIKKERDLIAYLDNVSDRLDGRRYIYHYTRLERCIDIFTSRLWFLSGANCMNDQLEYKNGDAKTWKNLFFACFMSDADESIGMWSMYSQPWKDGVQIAIPVSVAKKWIKGVRYIREISCTNFKPTGKTIDCNNQNRVFLSSVAYSTCDNPIDGQDRLSWSTVRNTNFPKASHNALLTGYVKDAAWEYEKELRIKAVIDNSRGFSKVAIDVPEFVLDAIVLTASPLFDGKLKDRLEKTIKRAFNTEKSLFSERLKLYNICDTCPRKK